MFTHLVLIVGFLFLYPPQAGALTLLSEDFEGATIYDNLTINLKDNPPLGSNDNLGKWIDFPDSLRWGITTSGGPTGDYAQHLVQLTDNTNLLFYGIDLSGLPSLTDFSLEFDYVASNRKPRVVLDGMLNGQHALDPNAPWFPPDDVDDGIPILDQQLGTTSSWSHASFTGIISQDYDVLAFGIIMGGTDGLRGIDNIELSVSPVPEPTTMLLLGTGLIGLAGFSRKKFKKS